MVFNWIKNAASKVWGGIRKGARWIGEKALPIGRKIVDFAKPVVNVVADVVPGIGGIIKKGVDFVDRAISGAERIKEKSDSGGGFEGVKQAVDEFRNFNKGQ